MAKAKSTIAQPTFKELVLMRHGTYSGRELNERGIFQVTSVAKQLVTAGKIGPIYTSPTHRAHQSALILKGVFKAEAGKNVPLHVVEWLECDRPYKGEIPTVVDPKETLIIAVSHQPNIEGMTHYFAKYAKPGEAEARVYVRRSWEDFGERQGHTALFQPVQPPPAPPPPPAASRSSDYDRGQHSRQAPSPAPAPSPSGNSSRRTWPDDDDIPF